MKGQFHGCKRNNAARGRDKPVSGFRPERRSPPRPSNLLETETRPIPLISGPRSRPRRLRPRPRHFARPRPLHTSAEHVCQGYNEVGQFTYLFFNNFNVVFCSVPQCLLRRRYTSQSFSVLSSSFGVIVLNTSSEHVLHRPKPFLSHNISVKL